MMYETLRIENSVVVVKKENGNGTMGDVFE